MAFVRKLQARIEDMAALENQGPQYMSPKKRFTRNIWGDILNTGFRIVSEIIPNYYVKAMIKSIQASLMEKKSGEHFLTTHLDRKLRRINDQLNSLKEVSTVQKMNRQFADIGRKIFTYEKHQLFLKHQIAEAARRGALIPGLAAVSSIRDAITHLKTTLGSGEKLALTRLGSLYELKAHLVQNDENLYISIGIPIVRVEDKRQGLILKNDYILAEKDKKLEILKIKNPNKLALIEEKDGTFNRLDLTHCLRLEGLFFCKTSFTMGPLSNSGNLTTSLQAGNFWETQQTQASWFLEGPIGLLHSMSDLRLFEICSQLQRKVEFSAGTHVFPRREKCTYFGENNKPIKLDDSEGLQIIYRSINIRQENWEGDDSGQLPTEEIIQWGLSITSFIMGLLIYTGIAYLKFVLARKRNLKDTSKGTRDLSPRSGSHDK